jgi:ribosomal protein S18 acetylase RimI-like enzyme
MSGAADLSFHRAVEADLLKLYQCDPYSKVHESRRLELRRMVQQNSCLIAVAGSRPLGFAVLEYSFFGNGFIPLICVAAEHHGKGVGLALLRALEPQCHTAKLFTSANASNGPAQRLFSRAGFTRSGIIENLDEGDPEFVYFKVLPTASQTALKKLLPSD